MKRLEFIGRSRAVFGATILYFWMRNNDGAAGYAYWREDLRRESSPTAAMMIAPLAIA
jgi:hypothetical protein